MVDVFEGDMELCKKEDPTAFIKCMKEEEEA